MQYSLILCSTLALCFGLQAFALRAVGGKTVKSESNFFSSLARIQSGIRDDPRAMLLGSSITGRLPDRASGFSGLVNMGCDGGSAVDALMAMDAGLLPAAPYLLIEGNTLGLAIEDRETEISKALRAPWFELGTRFDVVSATARPAAFLYSKLLTGKIGAVGSPNDTTAELTTKRYVPNLDSVHLASSGEERMVEKVSKIITRLGHKGTKCWIVILPPQIAVGSTQHNLAIALAATARIPFLDLGAGLPAAEIKLTDGVHMAPQSAALTARALLRELANTDP